MAFFSPDMSPIEHMGDILGRALAQIDPAPATIEDLLLHLQVECANIPQRKITNVMRSTNSIPCNMGFGGVLHLLLYTGLYD